jgi:hypothetical protein
LLGRDPDIELLECAFEPFGYQDETAIGNMSEPQLSYQPGKSKLTLHVRLIVAAVIVLLYGAACCFPALVFSRYYPGNSSPPTADTWSGAMALGLGWMSLFFGSLAWLANILVLLDLLFLVIGWRWATMISSGLTLLLSLDIFRLFFIEFPGDEGGVSRSSLQTLAPGVWLWLASIGAAFVAGAVLVLSEKSIYRRCPDADTTMKATQYDAPQNGNRL